MGRLSQALKLLALVAASALGAGCAGSGGAEFAAYQQVYSSARQSGDAILDRLAVAERRVHVGATPPISVATVGFSPDAARYYVSSVDPPATAAFRRALQILQRYNDALGALANGETAAAMAGRVSAIGAAAQGLGLSVAGAVGAAPTVATALSGIAGPTKALEPLLEAGLRLRTRAEFRALLLEERDTVIALIDGLIAATGDNTGVPCKSVSARRTTIFCVLVEPVLDPADGIEVRALTSDEIAEIENIRDLLAAWVVLLEESRSAFQAAVLAVESGSTGSAVLLGTLTDLDAVAREVRRALAEGG